MSLLTKLKIAMAALLGFFFIFGKRESEKAQADAEKAKDNAQAATAAAEVKTLEGKVAQDDNSAQAALDAYHQYRDAHPIDGSSGDKR